MCIDYANLYVTAIEFYENEHEERIDKDTLEALKKRMKILNSKESSLTSEEKEEIEDIFLIVFYNNYDSIWNEICFKDEIAQIRKKLQV